MTHPLAGHFSVDDSARLLRHYRYAAERMMRVLGGWLALTPELSAKLLMGRHLWDNAQHADAFGRRLPELRARAQVSEPPNQAFVAFMDALESPEARHQTVERLVGVYRVLKPNLLATYERHLARTNAVYEPPTRRILQDCVEDERRHVAGGEMILRHLIVTSALGERAGAWRGALDSLLTAAGGVTGGELSGPAETTAAAPVPAESVEAGEFIRLETVGARWPIPAELMRAVGALGDALVARDAAALDRWLVPGVPGREAAAALLQMSITTCRIVACARIGQQRVVKLRLDGGEQLPTLVVRWAPRPDGWCPVALEVAHPEAAPPA